MSRDAIGPETQAAIIAARGDRTAAGRALGIGRATMHRRLHGCIVPAGEGTELLGAWAEREWPTRGGRTSVAVTDTWTDDGERIYALDAHGNFRAGQHFNRVPISGSRPRNRVVCHECKEARETT